MKAFWTVVVVALVYGSVLFAVEQKRLETQDPAVARAKSPSVAAAKPHLIRASGRIKGRTEEIELRALIDEQIIQVHVQKGQWVTHDEVLVSLDPKPSIYERDLAEALLTVEKATKERLENGLRPSERETFRQEYEAALARVTRAEKSYARGVQLLRSQAISKQAFDDLESELEATRALAGAAEKRFETAQLPAREDELLAARGAVRAAESRLKIAQLKLDRTQIKAPFAGRVLSVEAELGELAGPESPVPLVVLADTENLRVLAEVDEFDALNVKPGQRCEIESDASDGTLARGKVVLIEPRMNPKQLFGQWAGERNDTSALRVWIDLDEHPDLPIGLPVDVFIHMH